jgi:hypothetical protein
LAESASVTIRAIVDTSGVRQGLDDVQRQADAAPVRVRTELAGSFGGEGPRGTGVPNVTTLTGTTTAPLLPPSQAVAQTTATAMALRQSAAAYAPPAYVPGMSLHDLYSGRPAPAPAPPLPEWTNSARYENPEPDLADVEALGRGGPAPKLPNSARPG